MALRAELAKPTAYLTRVESLVGREDFTQIFKVPVLLGFERHQEYDLRVSRILEISYLRLPRILEIFMALRAQLAKPTPYLRMPRVLEISWLCERSSQSQRRT